VRSNALAAGSRCTSRGFSMDRTAGLTGRPQEATATEAAAARVILWMDTRFPAIFENLTELQTERILQEIEDTIGGPVSYRQRLK